MRSLKETEVSTPGMLIIDKQDFLDNNNEYIDIETSHFPNKDWKIHISEAEGMGDKIREVFPRVEHLEWVSVLNDDHYAITKNWDKKLISQLNGNNFITCNDHWDAPARAAGATIFSMPLVKAFGFPLFPKQIKHLGIDDVWEQIGRATGCWKIDMSVVVEHHHIYKQIKKMEDFKDESIVDDTHAKVYGRGPWAGSLEAEQAQRALTDWVMNDFPDVVKRVKELRSTMKQPMV